MSKEQHLTEVWGAFDIWALPRSEIEAVGDAGDEILEAANLLENAFFDVRPVANSSSFVVDVGENGTICGTLTGRIDNDGKAPKLKFGFSGEPCNPPPVRRILDALNDYADDLVTVSRSG